MFKSDFLEEKKRLRTQQANKNKIVIEGRDNMDNARFYRDGGSDGFINVIFQGESQPVAYNGGKA